MAATLEAPPPAPAAAPAPAPKAAPDAVPSGAIQVGNQTAPPAQPPKPGSPKERMAQALRDNAAKKAAPPQPRVAPQPPPTSDKPIDQLAAPRNPDPASPPVEGAEAPTEAGQAEPAKQGQDAPQGQPEAKKPSPWKLKEEWQKRATQLEQELVTIKNNIVPEQERKVITEKMAKVEEENKALRDEIRYVNYEKSPEFQEKYQTPYKRAVEDALMEFEGLQVTDAQGNARPINANDILAVAAATSLPQAQELADALFGDYSQHAMNHRTEIRKLMNQRQAALEEWKKNGETHQKEFTTRQQAEMQRLNETISNTWKSFNDLLTKDERYGKYFSPVEGDQEGNQKLAKGYEMVDKAFSEDPREPGISAEERQRRVKRHVAVAKRAAAFGKLVNSLVQRDAKIAELEKQLKGYQQSEPEVAGRQPGSGTIQVSTLDTLKGKLRGLAR